MTSTVTTATRLRQANSYNGYNGHDELLEFHTLSAESTDLITDLFVPSKKRLWY